MDLKEVRELIDLLIEKDLEELELQQHGVSVRVRRRQPTVAPGVAAAEGSGPRVGAPSEPVSAAAGKSVYPPDAHLIRSPMVGTFYRAAEPGAEAFVELGDVVKEGQTLCIVEAMKLMNEINSDVNGKIIAIPAESGQPVEYGQDLFVIQSET